jgi:hypothetical protein
MKNKCIIALFVATTCIVACQPANTKHFRGIYADENADGLRNPERGLRLEVVLDVESGTILNSSLKQSLAIDATAQSKAEKITAVLESEALCYVSDSITLA